VTNHERPRTDVPVSCVPPTPAEAAIRSVRWAERGVLRRLVRLDDPDRAEEGGE
jgi:hypothetical protein